MENPNETKEQMIKIMIASPFVIMRYITLIGDTTLEPKAKMAFAQALASEKFDEFFGNTLEQVDLGLADNILAADMEMTQELVEQIALIVSLVMPNKENAFHYKKGLFDFAIEIKLSLNEVQDLGELDTFDQMMLSGLATSFNLVNEMEELDGAG